MEQKSPSRGELFILSAPSGAGKTTLIQRLLDSDDPDLDGIEFSVSYTTRRAREGERDGVDYHFVDTDRFQEMIADDEFLEWAEVHNNYYGTARREVEPRLEAGADVILDIDVQGAERVLHQRPDAHSIFIIPPSFRALEERLRRRGLDGEREIARRLAVSLWEIKRYDQYDYVIINDDADRASRVLAAVFLAQRHRRERVQPVIAELLEGFRRAGEAS
ncbi:MAG: guanylate kinase [Thermoanaerobaculia bacterium]|nr:guanylate kinase [Thermoanaerobaculia bacterium]